MSSILMTSRPMARRRADLRRGVLGLARDPRRAAPPLRGRARARSHCRYFAPPLIHFIPDSLTYSAPLFLKRQRDRTVGRAGHVHLLEDDLEWLRDGSGDRRARSHCRFVLLLIHFTPESLTYSVPRFLKRQCVILGDRPARGDGPRRGLLHLDELPHRARRAAGGGEDILTAPCIFCMENH